ncbi:hypothetical protein OUY22_21015 [Nonomuraea sp. MCN248]|uniref:Uncharacterized protein n=1 Tax=Nonomuraea corallina TaxID=2989783 RepID=A0ABT4SFZ8_9ACTN|nr:hypothetical protein [Nonomuraea corallina]MDA0635910.1 hypothetical protein [Nonomuraea corallina]
MTDQRLRELFDDLAETLPEGASGAGELWRRGARDRVLGRRRTAVAAAAVTVLVVAGVAVSREPAERDVTVYPSVTATSTAVLGPVMDTAPPPGGEAGLPVLASALPRRWADVPVVAGVAGPVLALAQYGDGRIYVVKSGGRIPLEVKLGGAAPLRPNSLSADGTLAAFPQRDEVVVVDLVIGRARSFPVPGSNVEVLWRGERILVGQRGADYVLDLATGQARRQSQRGMAGVAGYRDLWIGSTGDGGWTVVQEDGSEVELDIRDLAGGGGEPAGGLGWQRDGLVAVTRHDPAEGADVVVVADSATGRVVRTLLLPWGEPPATRCGEGGCAVRGWLSRDTVIVESGDRLLGWNIVTGALSRVADVSEGVVAYSLRNG